ncbi:hypothetical protein THARTR1_09818 [Trichoderma harzianum]|uniref:Uncharacterized protein n=1 Tax=Trichoderma harzianum TaxID=5544 RepID=A0A2K0TVI0_TRIHA|nr:hypothetical protein THARTR1_09818 [Trichoderma harzianum]
MQEDILLISTLCFLILQVNAFTKSVEEQVHSKNTLPRAMLKIELRTAELSNDLDVRKEANKTSFPSKANSKHRRPAHASETDVLKIDRIRPSVHTYNFGVRIGAKEVAKSYLLFRQALQNVSSST